MDDWRNLSGRPLSSTEWLEAHHRAKLPERTRFAERLAAMRPRRVVDLGCASGLWLDIFDTVLPPGCEFVGLDSDAAALEVASRRAAGWSRPATFELTDVTTDPASIPASDLTLIFNVLPFVEDAATLLARLSERSEPGVVAVRQYDGDSLRFGPMNPYARALLEGSLRDAVGASEQFRHYDMDRVFSAIHDAPFGRHDIEFELFQRVAPFPSDFIDYFEQTIEWTLLHLSNDAAEVLKAWRGEYLDAPSNPSYLFEVDLTAVLS